MLDLKEIIGAFQASKRGNGKWSQIGAIGKSRVVTISSGRLKPSKKHSPLQFLLKKLPASVTVEREGKNIQMPEILKNKCNR